MQTIRPFISVTPNDVSKERIQNMLDGVVPPGLYGKTRPEAWHVTLAYSENPVSTTALRMVLDPLLEYKASIIGSKVFGKEDSAALVLELESGDLQRRHEQLHEIPGMVYDWPAYRPHITVAWNAHKMPDAQTLDVSVVKRLYGLWSTGLRHRILKMRQLLLDLTLTGEHMAPIDNDYDVLWDR